MTRPSVRDRFRRMSQRSLFGPGPRGGAGAVDMTSAQTDEATPVGQARAEAVQRLQVGLFGIGAMVLLVGLASIIGSQADMAENAAVPEAAPTTEPTSAPTQANPLADAGVVPDITAEPSPTPQIAPLDLPPPPGPAGNDTPPQ